MNDGRLLALGATAALVAFGSLRRGSKLKTTTEGPIPSTLILWVFSNEVGKARFLFLPMTSQLLRLLKASRDAVSYAMAKMDDDFVTVTSPKGFPFHVTEEIPEELVPDPEDREALEDFISTYQVSHYDEWVSEGKGNPYDPKEGVRGDLPLDHYELVSSRTGFHILLRERNIDAEAESAEVTWKRLGWKPVERAKLKPAAPKAPPKRR